MRSECLGNNRFSVPFVMALLLSPSISHADISECHKVESSLERLDCYDKNTGRQNAPVKVPDSLREKLAKGLWSVEISKSKLTDEETVVLSLPSINFVSCKWKEDAPVALVLRCQENTTVAYFSTQCHMASGEYSTWGRVEWRVDDQKPIKSNMDQSTDNSALGLWSGGRSIPFIKRLLNGKHLVARMTPYGDNAITPEFNISGLENAINPLRKACHW